MKIQLIKVKLDGSNYVYKYKPFTYCCKKMQNDETIKFSDEDIVDCLDNSLDENGFSLPQFCISTVKIEGCWDDEWSVINNYPIRFCPYCGEKIIIEIVDEVNANNSLINMKEAREKLRVKCSQTDSKKEEAKLKEQIKRIDNQINDLYGFNEWKDGNKVSLQ